MDICSARCSSSSASPSASPSAMSAGAGAGAGAGACVAGAASPPSAAWSACCAPKGLTRCKRALRARFVLSPISAQGSERPPALIARQDQGCANPAGRPGVHPSGHRGVDALQPSPACNSGNTKVTARRTPAEPRQRSKVARACIDIASACCSSASSSMGSASPPAGSAGAPGAAPAPATGAAEGPATRALPSVPNVIFPGLTEQAYP